MPLHQMGELQPYRFKVEHRAGKLHQNADALSRREDGLGVDAPARGLELRGGQVKALQHKLCPDDWILGLHQTLIILLILGKWAMPQANDLTKDKLPQLLLIFVGLGADILEFTNETLSDIKENNPQMAYAILGVWTWSMLQFTLHLAVVSGSRSVKSPASHCLLSKSTTDMWSIAESIFIQDGPFLVVRLIVLIRYEILHQMLVFFTFKNLLVVTLNIYWFYVICRDRGSTPTSTPRDSISVPCNTDDALEDDPTPINNTSIICKTDEA
ncbi:transmembrane protein 26-like isoform X11 [Conger conger]|uniref:transmembrane protein 26-like isoform X11 n=1 Tax=Conger conger TaxID=82655 RepID=UPI002A5A1E38|nr:transmembrane protein 26-like isoform X11 [Conger conger]